MRSFEVDCIGHWRVARRAKHRRGIRRAEQHRRKRQRHEASGGDVRQAVATRGDANVDYASHASLLMALNSHLVILPLRS
ncbi:hypothetical protein U1Q18_022470 [Sarracenia purpurea var. burkii]